MAKKPLITYGYNHLEPDHPENPTNYRICGARTRQETSNPLCTRPAGWGTTHAGVGRCKLHWGSAGVGPTSPRYKHGRYASVYRGRLAEYARTLEDNDPDPTDLTDEIQVLRILLLLELEKITGEGATGQALIDAGLPIPLDQPSQDNPPEPPTTGLVVGGEEWTQAERAAVQPGEAPAEVSPEPVPISVDDLASSTDPGQPVAPGEEMREAAAEEERENPTPNPSPSGEGRHHQGHHKRDAENGMSLQRPQFLSSGDILIKSEQMDRIKGLVGEITDAVGKVVAMRNQTQITKAEMMWMVMKMREWIERFIPEEDQEAAVDWLKNELPMLSGSNNIGQDMV